MSATLFLAATITLWWTLHAWRTPQTLHATRFAPPDGSHAYTFSLLLPARHEEAVLARTVRQLLQSRHQAFELILIVGHDDPATSAVAHELAAEYPQVRVVVDQHAVKNKPKALNTALPTCTGDIVGVFDAEDQVHADLLTHVDYAFRTTDATVVQGGVQLINFHSNWYSVRNCLEYFFWFRSRLHLQAQRGFIPLGGNTVFVRADTLRQVGGWDPQCLAEDCDLGVRLSSIGCKVVVAYDALLVTREETPDSAMALFKQRTRWNQGFLQVLRKGDWRQLPSRRQRLLARYTLASPFVQAFTGVTTLAGFTMAILFDLPVGIALLSYLPLLPTVGTLFFEIIGLHDFGRQYGLRIRALDYAKLVVGVPVYMLLLAGAATRAVLREWRGRRDWELTRHVGAHLLPDAPTPATADA
ncbi:hypothetical protein GCM10010124_33000 [Pilimelia terevasa]|uniref:Glycosyltransferase n=1 Tax=Pilimelia terevasa TaxID=53372 RepID=A0A8J3FL44_9ACTN|nr:glycosyltransferase [Pilimelia terevasa]GGK37597.1 hypothetical protein GCM10010124_33000 [Pilimelia terevasa]